MNWVGWIIVSFLAILLAVSILFYLWSRSFNRKSRELWEGYRKSQKDQEAKGED